MQLSRVVFTPSSRCQRNHPTTSAVGSAPKEWRRWVRTVRSDVPVDESSSFPHPVTEVVFLVLERLERLREVINR